MAVTKNEILETISNMSIAEIVELIDAMEEKFGVTAQAAFAMPAGAMAGGQAAAAQEEKTEFNVVMSSFGTNKVGVIKIIREITGLGLKEAKDLVEAAPSVIKEAISKDDAAELKKKLEEAGASVEVK